MTRNKARRQALLAALATISQAAPLDTFDEVGRVYAPDGVPDEIKIVNGITIDATAKIVDGRVRAKGRRISAGDTCHSEWQQKLIAEYPQAHMMGWFVGNGFVIRYLKGVATMTIYTQNGYYRNLRETQEHEEHSNLVLQVLNRFDAWHPVNEPRKDAMHRLAKKLGKEVLYIPTLSSSELRKALRVMQRS